MRESGLAVNGKIAVILLTRISQEGWLHAKRASTGAKSGKNWEARTGAHGGVRPAARRRPFPLAVLSLFVTALPSR